ncbi:hypothetical protein SS50377_26617 [Spironucleus salmonicida]|uniref:C2H2-type domain-containing protein n=1 Tax=Spironucleus salmonicida TaxID=348837 RepID=V6LAI2_9EUKA|nr:hypothetical protein SS50377_26617 [Spironucleus salmonicida]|eukprot:EST41465.1 hypothetical protein SS50377_19187 [Spironucleus salmonicida]
MSIQFSNQGITGTHPFFYQRPTRPFDWQEFASRDIDMICNNSDIQQLGPLIQSLVHGDLNASLQGINVPAWVGRVFQSQQLFAQYLLYVQEQLQIQLQQPRIGEKENEMQAQINDLKRQLKAERQKRQADTMMLRLASLKPELVEHMPRCLECGKAFGDYQFLVSHYMRRHPGCEIPPPPMPTIPFELKCNHEPVREIIKEVIVEKPVYIEKEVQPPKPQSTSQTESDIFLTAKELKQQTNFSDEPLILNQGVYQSSPQFFQTGTYHATPAQNSQFNAGYKLPNSQQLSNIQLGTYRPDDDSFTCAFQHSPAEIAAIRAQLERQIQ